MTIDEEQVKKEIENIQTDIPGTIIEPDYYIENDKLIITPGQEGIKINTDSLINKIKDQLKDINSNQEYIEIPVDNAWPDKIDIEKIHSDIYKDVQDAYLTQNPTTVHPEVEGVDFNIEEAKTILEENREKYEIPLKITKPEVTVKNLPAEAFPDELGTYTTNFSSSSANRANNVRLAAQAINGTVLMPGEVFSYNGTVGQRTAARGYKEAGVYANGQVTTGIGGGICQVSSTLYNATLLANLEIVARSNHMFNPGYVPAGQDATVSWGGPDFQFKNTREYPIRISTSSDGGILTVSIHGSKIGDEYDEIKVQSYVVGSIPFSTEYQDDGSLPAGTTRVIQGGSNGCRATTYKVLYKDGNEISRSVVSNDTYNPHNQIVARGTAAANPEPTPTPTPTPTPEQPQDGDNSVTTGDGDITVSF